MLCTQMSPEDMMLSEITHKDNHQEHSTFSGLPCIQLKKGARGLNPGKKGEKLLAITWSENTRKSTNIIKQQKMLRCENCNRNTDNNDS